MRSPWYPVLMFLIGLRNRLEPGQSISIDYLRSSLKGAIREADQQVQKLGGSFSIQRDDSLYSVVSLADELVNLSKLDESLRLVWEGEPLEYEYMETKNRGEQFYQRLERLKEEYTAHYQQVLILYYYALCLGFQGINFMMPEKINKEIESIRGIIGIGGHSRNVISAEAAEHSITSDLPKQLRRPAWFWLGGVAAAMILYVALVTWGWSKAFSGLEKVLEPVTTVEEGITRK